MKTKDIYFKTLKFVWLKLGLGAAVFLLSVLWFAILTGINFLVKNGVFLYISIILWCVGTGAIDKILNVYFGYMIKAGHIAVVSQAVTTGVIPENQFETGKNMVTERFATSNVYFVVDKLVSGAVKQLQNGVERVGGLFDSIPGVSTIMSFAKIFIGIALGYVDECCLGYTFINKEQSAFKSACDGVVIYFQNWKKLLKNAAILAIAVLLITLGLGILPMIIFALIFSALGLPVFVGILLGLILGVILKSAFVDSYIMISMMVNYMEVAPQTEITYDLYNKLCNLSSKFKELFNKGNAEKQAQI